MIGHLEASAVGTTGSRAMLERQSRLHPFAKDECTRRLSISAA
jgi:hypothetical protein